MQIIMKQDGKEVAGSTAARVLDTASPKPFPGLQGRQQSKGASRLTELKAECPTATGSVG